MSSNVLTEYPESAQSQPPIQQPPIRVELNPFKGEDIALAHRMLESCDQLDSLYAKCTSCEIDVKALQEQCTAYRKFATAIIREFGGAANLG